MNAPVSETAYISDPAVYFENLKDLPYPFLLESSFRDGGMGRYSFAGASPFLVFSSKGDRILLRGRNISQKLRGNPFEVLKKLLEKYAPAARCAPKTRYPFTGGAVGYFGYELGGFFEDIPKNKTDDIGAPDCFMCFYDSVAATDHAAKKSHIISRCLKEGAFEIMERAALNPRRNAPRSHSKPQLHARFSSNFTKSAYLKAVKKIKEYIAAGDTYQVNLSQRFSSRLAKPPFELYKKLKTINPSPFGCFLDFGRMQVVSSSPERFLKIADGIVETRPIKGTRPRGRTKKEDRRLASELLKSGKDLAEHIMIVDLERNDLGRVCEFGTVRVVEKNVLEKYATVFHLVSTIRGKLRKNAGVFDCLKACFPGGSITGAPKIRSMEIINELEPGARSVYTGAIGYIGFNGNADLNIAIRTIICKNGKAYFSAGGGIVADSDPLAEYEESLLKGKALMEALNA